MTTQRRETPETEAIGLSIDMLDADRLRMWADKIRIEGRDISQDGGPIWLSGELLRIASCIETAVRDIGTLRQSAASASVIAEMEHLEYAMRRDADDLECMSDVENHNAQEAAKHLKQFAERLSGLLSRLQKGEQP